MSKSSIEVGTAADAVASALAELEAIAEELEEKAANQAIWSLPGAHERSEAAAALTEAAEKLELGMKFARLPPDVAGLKIWYRTTAKPNNPERRDNAVNKLTAVASLLSGRDNEDCQDFRSDLQDVIRIVESVTFPAYTSAKLGSHGSGVVRGRTP